uniref:sulfotransferase family protein n=2 Tax=Gelidibacter sp. TaxID=2018083 RepID=UPI0040491D9E
MSIETSLWKSNNPEALPDFIIGGAMKSGTTTLHSILDQHPDISIGLKDFGFFDVDSLLQHPDFNFFDTSSALWTSQDFSSNVDDYWSWYYSQFPDNNKKVKGEDYANYLSSSKAAERIGMQTKPIKLIFMLRHPTARTISNYLHALKSGRAIYSLEDTLKYDPYSILNRSLYLEQLTHYYKHIPHERIKIIAFEDLIADTNAVINDVCGFLGVDFEKMKNKIGSIHSNKTKVPKHIGLQLFRNKLFRYFADYRYANFVPNKPVSQKPISLTHRMFDRLHKIVNPQGTQYTFVPNTSTIALLDKFFQTELQGIDELTGMELYSKWFEK